jgi:simple sugar transport system ATP-binding protein
MTNCSAREISDMGVAHVPTERKRIGTVPNMTVRDNLILKTYRKPPFSHGMFLDNRAAEENARKAMDEYQIMAPSIDTAVKVLSGGNIQRVVLARELSGDPRLIIAAHPTYGLDVGATEQVREILLAQRDRGAGILLISEDLEEIMTMSDRILVLFEGRVMGVIDAKAAQIERIGLMMAGIEEEET